LDALCVSVLSRFAFLDLQTERSEDPKESKDQRIKRSEKQKKK